METPSRPIITLITDFGIRDHYVASVKGVILNICPKARIVDVSHSIARYDIREAAYVLYQASAYFPAGTIHLAVVDPGVGTRRRRLAIQGRRGIFVGPDNGVLVPAARREGIVRMVEVVRKKMMLPSISSTFEGRDIFAPVVAHLANGVELMELGPELDKPVELSWGSCETLHLKAVGQVIHIDGFGNIITNIPVSSVESWQHGSVIKVEVDHVQDSMVLSRSYDDVPEGKATVVAGSGGFLEISVNRGSAEEFFRVKIGSKVRLEIAQVGDSARR